LVLKFILDGGGYMKRKISIAILAAFSFWLANDVRADVVVPNSAAGVEADGTFAFTSTTAAGRTYQMTINANQLTGVIGDQLTGLQWRLNGAAATNWPPVDASFSFFNIFIGPGVAPSAMSNTFADNFTGTATQVRSGAITFPAGVFTSGSAPNVFGPSIMFDSAYLYSGGDLTVEIRFSNQTGATTQSPFDAVAVSGGPSNGWGVDFAARWTANSAGTTGANGNFIVTNFHTSAIPEPTSGCILALALVSLSLRRQR
jgi:hypothetical protein